jgi:hypothetical protein
MDKRGRSKMAAIVAMLAASSLNAQGLVPMAIGNVIAMQHASGPGRWVYDTDADYAVWDATSKTVAGSEASSTGKSVVIDEAPLVPQSLYTTDRDLVADGKTWLPKGGLLVKMVGGENGGNWFCTWRFDETASATSPQFPKHERELCLQTDGADRTTAGRLENSLFPIQLTILPSVRNVEIKNLSSVNLHESDRYTLPPRTSLKIFAQRRSRNGGTVCLHGMMDAVEARKEQCFGVVGQGIEYAGGRYTLIAMNQGNGFRVRVDRALVIHGLAPERR